MTRRRSLLLGSCAVALLLAAIAPAAAAPRPEAPSTTIVPAVLVGDSIVSLQFPLVRSAFVARGLGDVWFEAFAGRAIDRPMFYPSVGWVASGTSIVQSVRAAGIDAPLWVVELGANDLAQFDGGADPVGVARSLIDRMRAVIGPRTIAWATVRSSRWPTAVAAFNRALYDVAAADPRFLVIEWSQWSLGQPWFTDHVHLNAAGGSAIGRCLAAATRYGMAMADSDAPAPDRRTALRLGLVGATRMPDCPTLTS